MPLPQLQKVEPEQYFVESIGNGYSLPVLVYRNALSDTSPCSIMNTIEPNGWISGSIWGSRPSISPFHHECYGVIKGKSTYEVQVGRHPGDGDRYLTLGMTVGEGDVFVFPVCLSFSAVCLLKCNDFANRFF